MVSAKEVLDGIYSLDKCEFVDPEYEFKVQFVHGAKNHGGPYFRLYYSYEDYKKLYPDRADRYAIVADMRRYQECRWHKEWKESVSSFCSIEKCIKNPKTNKWKFADAFNEVTNTCIEFQHSFIDFDFEERNEFYSKMGIGVVWLYDLPKATLREREDGSMEILEDNARGFFRISENPDNLKNHYVYIQVKSGVIYRVTELGRLEANSGLKSTIRFFKPAQTLSADEFIEMIRKKSFCKKKQPTTLSSIWKPYYSCIVVENTTNGDTILINRDKKGHMYREFSSGCIQYKYVACDENNEEKPFTVKMNKDYSLSAKKESAPIWKLIYAKSI